MRRTLLLLSLLCLLPALAAAQVEPGQTLTGRVVEVTDGDTFDIRRSIGGEVTVGVFGGGCPEAPPSLGSGLFFTSSSPPEQSESPLPVFSF